MTLLVLRSCANPGSAGRSHRAALSRKSDARRKSGARPCRRAAPRSSPCRPRRRRSARLVASSNAALGSVLTAKLTPRLIREALRLAAKPRLSRFPSRAPRAHRAQPIPAALPARPARRPAHPGSALRPAQLFPPPCLRPARGPRPSRPRPAAPQTMGAGRYSPNKVRAMAQAGAGRPQRGRHWRGGDSRQRQGASATPAAAELPTATEGKGMRAARGRLGRARPRSGSSRPPCRPPALSVRPAASGSHLAPPHDPPPALLPQPAGPFPWQRGRPAAEAQRSAGAGRQVRSPGLLRPRGAAGTGRSDPGTKPCV